VRDHEVELNPASGLLSILGGKWTTYRAMAEDTINAVQKYLGGAATGCVTADHPLAGSEGYTPDPWKHLVETFGIGERTARHLAGKFGARARDVIAIAKQQRELTAPLVEGLGPLRAEVVFAAREEMAISIEDVLARRIGLELYGWKEAVQAAPAVADLLARELGWSESVRREALDQYVGRVRALMERAGLVAPQN
jgi:glycerol-3-phosphate dehydrogenase